MSLKGLIPSELTIENGFTYENVKIPLESQGLVFVRGVNNDTVQKRSNGSGKSSFADILEHVLFETTSRGMKKEEIIRAGSAQGYYAKLCLKNNTGVYYIEQAFGHSKHGTSLKISKKFDHGIEEISSPKHIGKAKKQLQSDILKMTLQQFHGYVYLSQEAGSPLVTGTGSEVSKYLSSTFGFDVYDGMRLRVKESIDALQERLAKAETYVSTMKDIDSKLLEFKDPEYIVEMETSMIGYVDFGQDQLAALHDLKSDIARNKVIAERRASLLNSVPAGSDATELVKLAVKRTKLFNAISSQLTELTTQKALLESRRATSDRLKTKKEEYKTLLAGKPDQIPDSVSDYDTLIHDMNSRMQTVISITNRGNALVGKRPEAPVGWDDELVVASHNNALVKFNENEKELVAIGSQYEKLKASRGSTVCLTCGQAIPHTDAKKHLDHEIEKADKARKAYAVLLKDSKAASAFLDQCSDYKDYRDSLLVVVNDICDFHDSDNTWDASDFETVYEQFRVDQDVRVLRSHISYATRLKSCNDEIKLLEEHLNDTASEDVDDLDFEKSYEVLRVKSLSVKTDIDSISEILGTLEELATLPNVSLSDLELSEKELAKEIQHLRLALQESQSILRKFSNDAAIINDLLQRKKVSAAYLDQFKDDFKQLDWLKTLYKGLAKLKARKLHSVVKSIRDTLPMYVESMFDGEDISFDIDDADTESVLLLAGRKHPEKKGERVWIPVRGLSKGERAGLRVSLLWTLKDIMQPEKSVDLLILDEADDGLDEAGLSAFCALLDRIRTQYGTVFVISQRRELTGVRFDQIWTAVKTGGITTLEMS